MGRKNRQIKTPRKESSDAVLVSKAMDLFGQGAVTQAISLLSGEVNRGGNQAKLWYALGYIYQGAGRDEDALHSYKEALAAEPSLAEAWNNLGLLYAKRGRRAEAENAFKQALQHSAGMHDASINLGRLLVEQGRAKEAVTIYQTALTSSDKPAQLCYALAVAYRAVNRPGQAIVYLEEALSLAPDYSPGHNLMGVVLMDMGMAEEALSHFHKAIEITPDDDGPRTNLAGLLQSLGRFQEAYEQAREAVALAPEKPLIHSNLLFLMNYQEALSRDEIYAEQRRWNERHALPVLQKSVRPETELTRDKKLRIGYVSPDFRFHPVCFFITPILSGFDRSHFEVFCYSNVSRPDQQTEKMKEWATGWRDICGVPDEEVAQWIRDDRIDILVDLAGHSGDNRLLVFAHKAAPVQITFLGNPDGTGMDAMDYRITDSWCDPVGLTECFHAEKLLRLPGNFFCYAPPSPAPDIGPLPCRQNGYVTFGSFNNFSKISENLLGIWSEIMQGVPESRLVFQAKPLTDKGKVLELKRFFESRGVAGDRILAKGNTSISEHLKLVTQVDIALDSFPWNGHTTTCHTLWMGVPVVSMAGERGISRMGLSILGGLGLERFVACNVSDYVKTAVDLSGNPGVLENFRKNIRSEILNSSWGNSLTYNETLENLFRDVWIKYCVEHQG
ncbi:tetratricopeptide repeat protein [Desulfuromonas sp. AOP6]|uniref:O-linked N-acetylglucosamine transferase, SPINDLY family protein n=1 Tax=Desulfuromonas sp. AOP6 TaxID=1566351 RepID=UPI001283AE35|nr:tetratricopeptide repeat protein [Desulfuromonas sp. AOP6]BCA79144.1 hypothetical protein AOP6_0931 [Desulfuromonas sp. AOP6]